MTTLAAVRCPCCGYRTLQSPETNCLCPVCWWEDDGQDDRDADLARCTVNGFLSLSQARDNFLRYGAAHPSFSAHVRTPLESEA